MTTTEANQKCWIELTDKQTNRPTAFPAPAITRVQGVSLGSIVYGAYPLPPEGLFVAESYAEVRLRIDNALNAVHGGE